MQAPLLDPGWVSMCKGMDKEPALRRARATIRIARRWAPNPQVGCALHQDQNSALQSSQPAGSMTCSGSVDSVPVMLTAHSDICCLYAVQSSWHRCPEHLLM
jgi:hypothetical protein